MTQPEALRLAEIIDDVPFNYGPVSAELRRLHELNQELLAALKRLMGETTSLQDAQEAAQQARAAIAKGEAK
jgi:hypothetical protein